MEFVLTVLYNPITGNRTHCPLIVTCLFAIALMELIEGRVRTPRCTDTFPIALLATTKIGDVLCLPIESLVMQIYSGST